MGHLTLILNNSCSLIYEWTIFVISMLHKGLFVKITAVLVYKLNRHYDSILVSVGIMAPQRIIVFLCIDPYVKTKLYDASYFYQFYPHIPWVMLNVWEYVCCPNKLTLTNTISLIWTFCFVISCSDLLCYQNNVYSLRSII